MNNKQQKPVTHGDISFFLSEDEIRSFIEQNLQLRSIDLTNRRIRVTKSAWFNYLARLEHLEAVRLDNWYCTKEEIQEFAKLKKLRGLEFIHSDLSQDFFIALTQLQNLTALSFDECSVEDPTDEPHDVNDQNIEQLLKLKNLRSLRIEYAATTDAGIKLLAEMTQLESIALVDANETGAILEDFKKLKNLKELTLERCAITDAGVRHLAVHKNLTKLRLRSSSIDTITSGSLKVISSLTLLSELCLRGCVDFDDEGVCYLGALTNLTKLELDANEITSKGLNCLGNLKRLRNLYLDYTCWVPASGLSFLTELKELETIEIRSVEDEVLKFLTTLPNLYSVNVSYNGSITDLGLRYLSEISNLTNLNLSSSCNKITDQGLSHLVQLKNLEELNLANCPLITDEGLKYLGQLDQLRSLNLSECVHITDRGVAYLSNLKNLRYLNLYKCELVTDKAIPEIAKLTNLRSVELKFCKVSNVAGEKLEECLPHAGISRIQWRAKSKLGGGTYAG